MTVNVSKPAINVREKLAELDKPTGIAGEAMLRAETPQEQFNLIGAGRRRMNINGAMNVSQRGTSFTGITSGNTMTLDRMKFKNTTSGTWTVSQDTDAPDGYENSLKALCTAATSSPSQLRIMYAFEGQDVAHLAYGSSSAQYLTISFWIKSNVTGVYSVSLETDVAGRQASMPVVVNASGVWEKKELLFQPDTSVAISGLDNTEGLTFSLWIADNAGLGSQGSSNGQWVTNTSYQYLTGDMTVNAASAVNNYVMLTGLQLEVGKVATPFEHRSYGEELALCQRYYEEVPFGRITGYHTGTVRAGFQWKVNKRATPTVTFSSSVLSTGASVTLAPSGPTTYGMSINASAGVASSGIQSQISIDAEL